jgi:hypothetical protein
MRALVLFCGTGSIDRAFQRLGWDVVSVDWVAKYAPTHVADIMTWDYQQYPKGHFDFVWGSPACTQFSIARTTGGPRDLEGACALVAKTLEIMEFFGCPYALENPATGLLKHQPLMAGLPWDDVTYCAYSPPGGYRKKTRIWHTLGAAWSPRPPCCKATPCATFAAEGMHNLSAQRGPTKTRIGLRAWDNCTLSQLYSMPPELCDELAAAAHKLAASSKRNNGRDTAEAAAPEVQAELRAD